MPLSPKPTPSQKIPMVDLQAEVNFLWNDLNEAIQNVLRSTQFIMGKEVLLFEQEVAAYLGVKHAIGLNSGTDALVIGLRALGIGQGDEVITTPFSFFATAESISNVGAKPIFVDIEEESMNINPRLIEAQITSRTRAIMPVHLFGKPAKMDEIMQIAHKHDLYVIEDCAQSFGAKYQGQQTGTIGNVGAYSFFPSKNLGGYGDAGMMVTNSDHVAEMMKTLRSHGSKKKYHNEILGYNSRLDTLQAAILRVKLPYVEEWNEKRGNVAVNYNQILANHPRIIVPEATIGHVFHQYTIRLVDIDRVAVQKHLEEKGISSMVYYPIPQDRLPIYDGQYEPNPVSDQIAQQVLSLPISPWITEEQHTYIAEVLREFLDTY